MSALLLGKLFGKIIADSMAAEDGRRYLRAKTKLHCVSHLEENQRLGIPSLFP